MKERRRWYTKQPHLLGIWSASCPSTAAHTKQLHRIPSLTSHAERFQVVLFSFFLSVVVYL